MVYENDNPALLAREFSLKYNLPHKQEVALSQHIYTLIQEVNREHAYLTSLVASKPEISSASCKNIGEKLYVKGLYHKEQVEVNAQIMKMDRERRVAATTSFKPIINENSKIIASKAPSRSITDSHHRTFQSSDIAYPFSPKINEKSAKLAGNSTNRVQELYEDAKLRENRLEQMNASARKNEFPFRPDIKHTEAHSDPQALVERLSSSKANYYENMQDLKKKYEVSRDPATGQEYFKPNICKSMGSLRSHDTPRSHCNVWETLYSQKKKQVECEDFPYSPVKLESKAKSDKLLMKVKIDRFSDIFQQLNPDVNGLIRYKNIKIDEVEPGILRVIEPLLGELEELNQPLNFQEFVDSMENLLKILHPVEKDIFLTKPKKKIEESEMSTKKSVNSCDYSNLYLRNVEQKNMTAARLEIQREMKKILEVEGCTFKPKTTKFPIRLFK